MTIMNDPVYGGPHRYRRPGLVRMLLEFMFPHYCKVCGHRLDPSEDQLCITCFLGMPRLEYSMERLNPTEQMLITEKSLDRAVSLLQYNKESEYRNILFHLKYWHHPKVGTWLARLGAMELMEKGFFDGIDCIVPVPLTRRKEIRRGYNQCMFIAKGIRKVTGLPIIRNAIVRENEHSRQAGLGKYQRWGNAQDLFKVADPTLLQGKHALIIDDVITTGATLCSLIDVMEQSIPDLKVSVFTLAIAN